jgi:signal transduction histidine kinase/ActR/RegA family two-component response regulator
METKSLPRWTWLAPFLILPLASYFSTFFTAKPGIYLLYFPINIGLLLSLWWGPRVYIAMYLNSFISLSLMHVGQMEWYPLYGIAETLQVVLARTFIKSRMKEPMWSPSPENLVQFFIYGLIIPSAICSPLIEFMFAITGIIHRDQIGQTTVITFIGDTLGSVSITLPLLVMITPYLTIRGLSLFPVKPVQTKWFQEITRKETTIFVVMLLGTVLLNLFWDISRTWYLFGIVLLVFASWYGLKPTFLANIWLIGISLILPQMMPANNAQTVLTTESLATLLTLCFSALITGASVSSQQDKIDILRQTENDLKSAKEQAEEASVAKSEFLARMSHEIRTPLNSVLGILELLRETHLSKDQERYLTLFSHAGENLKALINDLLDFSKIEAKALKVENVSYNLHATVRSVFEILQIKAEEKGLNFELDIDKNLPPFLFGDPTRLRQVLFNLVGNALKFTEEGHVSISVLRGNAEENFFTIQIKDSGIGISREKQTRLFSPFSQGDTSITRRYGGTGLGLVISKNLIEIMGGTLELKSLAGRGTTFLINLPYHPDLNAQEKPTAPKAATLWPAAFDGQQFRILLTDDSEDNRLLIVHYLKHLPITCDEAINGKDALEKFKQNHYDLVLMDMQMPIMSGYKATELIRLYEKENHKESIPIIALTATAVVEDLERTLKSGCNSYVVKPVKKADIIEILVQNLKPKTASQKQEPPAPEKPTDYFL